MWLLRHMIHYSNGAFFCHFLTPFLREVNAQTNTWQQRVFVSADTTDLENQIDEMIYQLYELTEEEIAIIEVSSK